jgi:hypothetical protein
VTKERTRCYETNQLSPKPPPLRANVAKLR